MYDDAEENRKWMEDEKTWITKGAGRSKVVSVSGEEGGEKAEGKVRKSCVLFPLAESWQKLVCINNRKQNELRRWGFFIRKSKLCQGDARKTDRGTNSDCHRSTGAAFLYDLS